MAGLSCDRSGGGDIRAAKRIEGRDDPERLRCQGIVCVYQPQPLLAALELVLEALHLIGGRAMARLTQGARRSHAGVPPRTRSSTTSSMLIRSRLRCVSGIGERACQK